MASEDSGYVVLAIPNAEKPAAAPMGRKKSPKHPPYEEMIKQAILGLKKRTGLSQHGIAKFIEEIYDKELLPGNFRKLLSGHLKRLVSAGKLVKVKNSFKLPPKKFRSGGDGKSVIGKGKTKAMAEPKERQTAMAKGKATVKGSKLAAKKAKPLAANAELTKRPTAMAKGKTTVKGSKLAAEKAKPLAAKAEPTKRPTATAKGKATVKGPKLAAKKAKPLAAKAEPTKKPTATAKGKATVKGSKLAAKPLAVKADKNLTEKKTVAGSHKRAAAARAKKHGNLVAEAKAGTGVADGKKGKGKKK